LEGSLDEYLNDLQQSLQIETRLSKPQKREKAEISVTILFFFSATTYFLNTWKKRENIEGEYP
jgi:hypothetical protein